VGVVSAGGGPTRWLAVPGDPREHYLARMDWAATSDEVVVQQLDRRQHTLAVMLGDARTGAVRTVLTERDTTWVDVVNDVRWLDGGRRFTWVSERDGWRRLYAVPRGGGAATPLTPAFDLHNPGPAPTARRGGSTSPRRPTRPRSSPCTARASTGAGGPSG
jgi:dipeptidyl-peptidase-4